jgi:hypothetical protein
MPRPSAGTGTVSCPEGIIITYVVVVELHHLLGECEIFGIQRIGINTLAFGKVDYV